jgi:O-acetyl-ADP-ribose deacetylase (regulator of RNase III)
MSIAAEFVSQYTPATRNQIDFAWNGKHASEFQDSNQEFRWQVVSYCIEQPVQASPLLLEHLFLADAEWAAEAWGSPHHFAQLASVLLERGQEAVLDTFSKGFVRSFDTFGSCHHIQLSKALLVRLTVSVKKSFSQATEQNHRKRFKKVLELFAKLQNETARQGWGIIAPGTPTPNIQDALKRDNAIATQITIGKTTLRLVDGDIAEQDTDAVVTAAHYRLNMGTGTDGTIHTKGGPKIYEESQRIGGCPIGDAVITTGGNLKARYVIHAVGPVWNGGDEREPELLASAYRRSLELAAQHGLRSISIPSISTGAFVYPIRLAAPIALKTIVQFLEEEQHSLDEVRMVLYTRENDTAYTEFEHALEQIMKGE